jgi:hypothetical protein
VTTAPKEQTDLALFVFGAGATRGASFVDPTKDPCLPPLDSDFFTQLQRVQNQKHQSLIKQVTQDVVELFGVNFSVTVETVFTTLENTIRMLETTGENRDFRRSELQEKRSRLEQAIAVAFEDSLAEKAAGHSSLTPRPCDYHSRFVSDLLQAGDDIISFNYDCLLDFALRDRGSGKWHPRYGYGFKLGARGKLLTGDQFWRPTTPPPPGNDNTVHLYKLHGSLHFQISGPDDNPCIYLKQRPYTKQKGNLKFSIIPPEWHKAYDKSAYANLWKRAASAIHENKEFVFIGYSLPLTDSHATALFLTSVPKTSIKSLVLVNPDPEARRRIRTVVQRGLRKNTRVVSFNKLEEFVAAKRSLWGR